MRGWILASDPGDAMRIGRTERSLTQAGIASEIIENREAFIARMSSANEPVLLIEAGTWFAGSDPLPPIPASATGRALIALGALGAVRHRSHTSHPSHLRAEQWREAMQKHGGDFDNAGNLPTPTSAYLEAAAAKHFGALLKREHDAASAWNLLLAAREFRKVHLSALDVHEFAGMRVLQVITSIHLGGAERVTLDLAHELSRQGVATAVAALGRPAREAFPEPPHFYDLSRTPCEAVARGEAIAAAARDFGADLIHAHLISADEAREIRARADSLSW